MRAKVDDRTANIARLSHRSRVTALLLDNSAPSGWRMRWIGHVGAPGASRRLTRDGGMATHAFGSRWRRRPVGVASDFYDGLAVPSIDDLAPHPKKAELHSPTGSDSFGRGTTSGGAVCFEHRRWHAEFDERAQYLGGPRRTQALGVPLVGRRVPHDGDALELRVLLLRRNELRESRYPVRIETCGTGFERDRENNLDGYVRKEAHRRVGAPVVVLITVIGLRLARTLVANIGDAVAVIVEVVTAVRILESVAIFRFGRTLIALIRHPVAIRVASRDCNTRCARWVHIRILV